MKKNLKNLNFEIQKRYRNGMKLGTISVNLKIPYKEIKKVVEEYERLKKIKETSDNYNKQIQVANSKQPGRSNYITKILNVK
jgi:hypothetical protein